MDVRYRLHIAFHFGVCFILLTQFTRKCVVKFHVGILNVFQRGILAGFHLATQSWTHLLFHSFSKLDYIDSEYGFPSSLWGAYH